MKKLFTICCIVASLAFVSAKPVMAEPLMKESTACCYDSWSYFLGKANARLTWSYIMNEKVLDSSGYTTVTGIGIEAYCNRMTATDYSHDWHVGVVRGIGLEVGGGSGDKATGEISISGAVTLANHDYYYSLRYDGTSFDGSGVFGD